MIPGRVSDKKSKIVSAGLTFAISEPTVTFDELDRFVRYVRRLVVDVTYAVLKKYETWLVTDLRYGSAVVSVLPESVDSAETISNVLLDGIRQIERGDAKPSHFSESSIRYVGLVSKIPRSGCVAVSFRDMEPVQLGPDFYEKSKKLLRPRKSYYGSLLGSLDVVSVHKGQRITLYGDDGTVVRCKIKPALIERAVELLGKRALVAGILHVNDRADLLSVDVEDIWDAPLRTASNKIPLLYGAVPDVTGGLASAEYLIVSWGAD